VEVNHNVSKKRLDKIESDRAEVKDTATIDLEWNIKESMNIPRPRSSQRAFVLIEVKELYYIFQGILIDLIQRKH
jgi:hypothetical protein